MPILATTGWHPVRATDLRATGAEPGVCQRCTRTNLRFLHTIEHENGAQLQVGCECARRLCCGYDPHCTESRLRNLWSRRSRWLARDWRVSRSGNATLVLRHDGEKVRVTVFRRGAGYEYCIAGFGETLFSSSRFPTADSAKLVAFDVIAEAFEW